jgi:hypothetical protein
MVVMPTSLSIEFEKKQIQSHDISQLNAHIYMHGLRSISWPPCPFQSLEDLTICPMGRSDLCAIPSLPALRNLEIDCDDGGGDDLCSILVDLTKLPQLLSFELQAYTGGLTILGSHNVRTL